MARFFPLLTLPMLAACTVGPDYKGPPATASGLPSRAAFVRAHDPSFEPAQGLARWWESLGDPVLSALVLEALAHNPDVDIAKGRIREAATQLSGSRADRMPSIKANSTFIHAELPGASGMEAGSNSARSSLDINTLGFEASWEIDLFGGGHRQLEESRALLGAHQADLADAQVSLSAQISRIYIDLRDAQQRAALDARVMELQEQALILMRQRFDRGTSSALDVERLRFQLNSGQAQAQAVSGEIETCLDALATLTGRNPGALDATLTPSRPIPLPPARVLIGDPASLIARRPDVRAAERTLAAAVAAIGVSTAQRFPHVSFFGLLGLGGTSPSNVVDIGKMATLGAPMLSWSFLDFGRGAAEVHRSEARRDQSEAQYRKTVIGALQDAENSLSGFGNARLQLASLAGAQESTARATRLSGQRFAAGTISLIDQLDTEYQQLAASLALSRGKAALAKSYVEVQKSLGMGWSSHMGP